MTSVAEIAPIGRDPGLVVLVCTDCGTTDSELIYPVQKPRTLTLGPVSRIS
jgi:hypothetical protein